MIPDSVRNTFGPRLRPDSFTFFAPRAIHGLVSDYELFNQPTLRRRLELRGSLPTYRWTSKHHGVFFYLSLSTCFVTGIPTFTSLILHFFSLAPFSWPR